MTEEPNQKENESSSNNFRKIIKTAYSFEGWKFSMIGSFWGMLSGIASAYLIPQNWVKNNKPLNKYFITGAEFPEKIYVPRVMGMFSLVGTVIGGIIDIFRNSEQPQKQEHIQWQIPYKEKTVAEPDILLEENNTKMQNMVTSRRQESVQIKKASL